MHKDYGKVLGELETQVMEIIWHAENPVSVRSVTEAIQKKRKIAYTTVMTIMGRLVKKGILVRKLDGSTYFYKPKLTRDQFMAKAVHNIFTTAVSTLGTEVVTHFAKEMQKLSPEKRKELLTILDK